MHFLPVKVLMRVTGRSCSDSVFPASQSSLVFIMIALTRRRSEASLGKSEAIRGLLMYTDHAEAEMLFLSFEINSHNQAALNE